MANIPPAIGAKGVTEVMGDGRPVNKPGVYRREDGKEIITTVDPTFGKIQADAIVQQGYVWVGDVPSKTNQAQEKSEAK